MFAALYGRPFTSADFVALGKRVLAQERAFNTRAGFGEAQDRLPDFFRKEKLAPHDVTFTVPDEELDQVLNFT
jgi:aldehyde:ferredoxin oxidoreductase